MKIAGYDLDMDHIIDQIVQKQYSTLALQVPEGLKHSLRPIVNYLEQQTRARVIVLADPCFGACDIPVNSLYNLPIDCIIHIGHTKLLPHHDQSIPVLYVTAAADIDVYRVVEKACSLLVGNRIGLVTTAQHLHTLQKLSKFLQDHGFKPIVGKGDSRVTADGQILGCNFSSATSVVGSVDSYLFLGSGMFHPLGLLLATKKPVIAADPYTLQVKRQELEDMKDSLLRQRYGAIAAAKTAKTFGILVGLKPGQQRLQLVFHLKTIIESARRTSLILAVNYVSPEILQSFLDIDCFISTICPRIAIDDYLQYKKPLITPVEAEIAFGVRSWQTYIFDQICDEHIR
ncbi:MAG: diphthamide biosynthesis enzyme Dph2 [Candidatus Thermoplasmatota archaeon]